MTIQFECPHCGNVLKTSDDRAGLTAKCPSCAEQLHIPYQMGSLYDSGQDSTDSEVDSESRREVNPYAAPVGSGAYADYDDLPLAGRGARFGAFFLDNLISLVAAIPGFGILIVGAQNDGVQVIGLLLIVAGILGINIFQWVLLTRDGQTLGKKVLKIKIVDYRYGDQLGFGRIVGMRIWLNGLIGAVPYIGSCYALVDALCIFGQEKRCVHDLLADSKVVEVW